MAVTGGDALLAYRGLYEGSIGRPESLSESLVWATPYVFGGLAVAFAFKAGLFNIGAEGQIGLGALCAVYAGYAISGLPWPIHLGVAIAAGMLGGAAWGFIPGALKARTGAHEVITTIMLNYVAIQVTSWLLAGPMKDPSPFIAVAQTPKIADAARLPVLFEGFRLHWGFPLALGVAIAVWWLIQSTTIGFEIRTVGANPHAARYAGISVARTTMLAMSVSGALAGLAGTIEVVGLNYYHTPGFSVGYGFDSIAVALLGRNNPLGLIPAALLFGGLRAGATRMQFLSQIPIDIISIIQALILVFIAAPEIIRFIYRVRPADTATDVKLSTSWGRGR
ncbi:MAG: ABC transporter permease [Chloroflexota bacterium]|nr:MAG: ABC transporter permease [Chloroflexota bacterium]